MKIAGSYIEKKHVEINVSAWDVFFLLRAETFKKAGIDNCDAFISKDGKKIMFEEEIRTSHTSYHDEVLIEKPTLLQLELVKQFEDLRTTLGRLDL